MSVLKQRRNLVPQVGRALSSESHTGSPVSLMDSGGGKKSTRTQRLSPKKVSKLQIATYNIRSMAKDEKIYELEEELKRINWNIVGLSEVKRRGEQCIDLFSGNRLYYRGDENEAYGGIGFLVKRDIKEQIQKFKCISNRVGYITVKINEKSSIKLIQVYAPTSTSGNEDIDNFYDDISEAIEDCPIKTTIIMGDFNAKLGTKQDSESKIGSCGYGSRNERGDRLVEYLEQENLYAINTFFKKRKNRKWTWISPDGRTKN